MRRKISYGIIKQEYLAQIIVKEGINCFWGKRVKSGIEENAGDLNENWKTLNYRGEKKWLMII